MPRSGLPNRRCRPSCWGSPDFAQAQFAAAGLDATVEPRDFSWHFPSDEVAFETFATAAGGFMLYLQAMREQGLHDAACDALRQTIAEVNVASDGTCHLPADYLLTTAPADPVPAASTRVRNPSETRHFAPEFAPALELGCEPGRNDGFRTRVDGGLVTWSRLSHSWATIER